MSTLPEKWAVEITSLQDAETDHKAKYEALVQGVKEAMGEMSARFDEEMEAGCPLRADAFTDARNILFDKTGIKP